MSTCIALFRGINVGGKHLLPMRELVDDLQSLGCEDVRTYIQSGNAVFEYSRSVASLGKRISKKIEERHGFGPHVLILDADQLHQAIASNPFPEAESDPKTLHLSFLASPLPRLAARQINALGALKSPTERYNLIDHVFYLHAPDGVGRSKLAAKVEKSLGVPATARNWRTVVKLAEMV
jgi:uncharacterized protein (DUF1697 family)